MAQISLKIDGRAVMGSEGQTILDIARANGVDIPTLCHDERTAIFGSCGLCVVENEGSPKLLRSCSTFAVNNMNIFTNTPRIRENRLAALELLLSDHTGDCRPPCMLACPGQTDCQGYVGLIANGEYGEAYKLIKDKIPLPGSIGRVCPHPCEEACRRKLIEEPISIAALKQFAADDEHDRGVIYTADVSAPTGKRAAIVGGGPGGLSAAYFLRSKGHDVTIYDAMPLMGGMLRYGIPEYRLPKKVLQEEIDAIEKMGVKMINNARVGSDMTLDELKRDYDAVVIAIGAWSSTGAGCPGDELSGVHGGIEFLWNITGITEKLLRRKVAIVGGGNTAMDACRTAVRSGASTVYNIYRRTRNEMPAEESEIIEAEEEGVIFKNLTNPIEIIGENGKVKSIRLQIMELGEPDASGRRRPVPVPGQEVTIDVDVVIMAIGQKPDTLGFDDIKQSKWGTIIADEHTFCTNIEGVFAIGDATNNGADIAITAIGEAQRASIMIDRYLRGESLTYNDRFLVKSEKTAEDLAHYKKAARVRMPHRSPADRKKDFLEINYGYNEAEAVREASRCLECGCMDYFECKLLMYSNDYKARADKYAGSCHHRVREDNDPYIRRDPDKCVLCGLCVRVCEEVTGSTALGFMDRGFDTIVNTAFDAELKDTDCISCGQCAYLCPTGALTETQAIKKQVPLEEHMTDTVCPACSLGCKLRLTANGHMLLRALPSADAGSLLCEKGRFGFGDINKAERVTTPLIRTKTGLVAVGFEGAIAFANDSLKRLQKKYGNDCVALAISDRYTNEEAALIIKYAKKVFNTNMVYSLGLTDAYISDAPAAVLDEMDAADLIVLIAPKPEFNRSVAAMKIKRAERNGAKLLIVNDYNEINSALADIAANVKNAVFIYDTSAIPVAAARRVADIAINWIKPGERNCGVVQLLPGANSRGLYNLGVRAGSELRAKLESGEIRGLFAFGEGIVGLDFRLIEFLAVQKLHLTEAARQADVLLPASYFTETDGSFTAYDNVTRTLNKAVNSPAALSNTEQIQALIRQG